jgi:hypothetical protein
MQTVFSEALLAGLRTLRDEEDVRSDDPDDSIEPDDSGPRLSIRFEPNVDKSYVCPKPLETEQAGRCGPDTLEQSNAPQSPLAATAAARSVPNPPDLLDPAVLRTMPPRVAAFMLYEPPEPPPWRRQETDGARAHRETLEDLGGWVG